MRISRVQNIEGIDLLAEHLLVEDGVSRESTVELLKQLMQFDPESCCILAAHEEGQIKAFIISAAEPKKSHVFLYQAWADESVPRQVRDKMFIRTCLWADAIGRTEIRTETKRNEESIQRRWGFEHFSTIMSFQIPDDMSFPFLKENSNGPVEQPKQREYPVEGTEADLKRDPAVPDGKDRSAGTGVRGSAGSGPAAGTSAEPVKPDSSSGQDKSV